MRQIRKQEPAGWLQRLMFVEMLLACVHGDILRSLLNNSWHASGCWGTGGLSQIQDPGRKSTPMMCSTLRHPLGVVWVLRQMCLMTLRRCWLVGQRCCRLSYPVRPAARAEIVSVPYL